MKSLFLTLISFFIFSTSALELKSEPFFVCLQKTATVIQSRSIRVHQFSDKSRCAVIYSVDGRDQMISQAYRMSFCHKKAQQVVDNLEKGLWECKKQNQAELFYPVLSSSENKPSLDKMSD